MRQERRFSNFAGGAARGGIVSLSQKSSRFLGSPGKHSRFFDWDLNRDFWHSQFTAKPKWIPSSDYHREPQG